MSPAVAADSFRFRPPAVEIPPGARWALRRGFAAAASAPGIEAPEDAADWASRLGVVERIGALQPREGLAAELGNGPAADYRAAGHRAAAVNLALRELAALTVMTAAERGIEVILLKGMALLETVPDLDARRPLADVDVLVDETAAAELAIALETAGLTRSDVHESSQHLPALYHPRLGTLEIHLRLRGLRVPGGGEVTGASLLAAGVHHPAPELAPARLPARAVLAAHAIAHGLVQNAHSPRGYPLLRMAADLVDLGGAIDTMKRSSVAPVPPWRAYPEERTSGLALQAGPWLRGHVSPRELEAVAGLCRHLVAGTLPAPGSDPARILDHVVAAHLDPDYLRALEIRALGAALRRRDWLKLRRRAANPPSPRRLFRVGWSWLSQRLRRGGAAEGP